MGKKSLKSLKPSDWFAFSSEQLRYAENTLCFYAIRLKWDSTKVFTTSGMFFPKSVLWVVISITLWHLEDKWGFDCYDSSFWLSLIRRVKCLVKKVRTFWRQEWTVGSVAATVSTRLWFGSRPSLKTGVSRRTEKRGAAGEGWGRSIARPPCCKMYGTADLVSDPGGQR